MEVGVGNPEITHLNTCRDRVRKAKADLDYCIPFLATSPWRVKCRATKINKEQEHFSCEERLGELRLFTLQKRRFRWDLINVYKQLKSRNEEEGDRLFSVVLCDRTRGNEHKLRHMNPMWAQGSTSVRIVKHWLDRLLREAVESSFDEILKLILETYLRWVCLSWGFASGELRMSLPKFTILWFCNLFIAAASWLSKLHTIKGALKDRIWAEVCLWRQQIISSVSLPFFSQPH